MELVIIRKTPIYLTVSHKKTSPWGDVLVLYIQLIVVNAFGFQLQVVFPANQCSKY